MCQILIVSRNHYSSSFYSSLILTKTNEVLAVYLTKIRNYLFFHSLPCSYIILGRFTFKCAWYGIQSRSCRTQAGQRAKSMFLYTEYGEELLLMHNRVMKKKSKISMLVSTSHAIFCSDFYIIYKTKILSCYNHCHLASLKANQHRQTDLTDLTKIY